MIAGTILSNRYEIVREIGRGGMGIVYLARDLLLDREIAVKVMIPAAMSPDVEERFKREARVVARMDHPGIVGIHDVGEHDGSLYFVMPFVDGTNLRFLQRSRALRLDDVIDVGVQVAEALDFSNARGVVHRDIKPENILVTIEDRGTLRIRITDFGVALSAADTRLTLTGSLTGTLSYLSPEQIAGKELDGRADIYSLGTVLYECLAGEPPFAGAALSVIERIAHEDPVPLGVRQSGVDAELDAIVMRCLEKDPARRPERAIEVAEALARYRSPLEATERARRVLSGIQSYRAERPSLPAFVGRENELGELRRRLDAALSGECQVVLVGGDVGSGKTRLLEELERVADSRGICVLHGRFVEQDRAFPYQGFCDVIREHFRIHPPSPRSPDLSDLAEDLASLFPELTEIADVMSASGAIGKTKSPPTRKISEDRTYIFELLARTLVRISGSAPLVILLEDLHSADVSIEALQYAGRRLSAVPVLIVGTYVTTLTGREHPLTRMIDCFHGDRRFASIVLDPFQLDQHHALLEILLGDSRITESLASQLYEATEGNPYFTRELVRSLLESGDIVRDAGGKWTLSGTGISADSMPLTIQQTVERRIERLPEDLQSILSTASILGQEFEYRELEILLQGRAGIDETVDRLLKDGLIEEERESRGDRLAFSSRVMRDVLYGRLPRSRRKALHRRFAEYVETRSTGRLGAVYPLLVHHYTRGDVPDKVIEYGLRLARKSLDAASGEEGLRAARLVLDYAEEAGGASVEGEARLLLGRAHRQLGNVDAALKEFETTARILENERQTNLLASTLLMAAETAWESRRAEEARRWIERGLDIARQLDEKETLLRLLSLAATTANLRGEYAQARDHIDEIERLRGGTAAAASTPGEVCRGGKLTVALPVSVQATHPAGLKLDEEAEVFATTFERLINTDALGNLVPCLCVRWEVQEDGKLFLLTLRPNVRLHDGSALSAVQVKASFELAIGIAARGLPPAFSAISGVADFLEGRAAEVSGIQVLSEHGLSIRLHERLPIYPALLTDTRTAITKELTTAGEPGAVAPLAGTGPFRIASFTTDRVELVRNPDYWQLDLPMLDAIEFRAGMSAADIATRLRSGEIDIGRDLLPEDLDEILRDRRLRADLVEATKTNLYFVLFNTTSPAGGLEPLRQAMCGVVRTHDLVRSTLGRFAQPAETLYPPGILGHDPGRRRRPLAVEEALDLLRRAALSPPIALKASVHPILQDKYAPLIKALFRTWSELRITVSIMTPTMASFLESLHRNEGIDLLIGRWIAEYDDPDDFTYSLFHSKMGDRHSYHSSPEMDAIMEKARAESQPYLRLQLYRQIEDIMLRPACLLPLFHEIDYRVAHPRIQRLKLRSSAPYVNYAELGRASEAPVAAAGRSGGGGTLHVPITGEIHSLDPALVNTVAQGQVIPAMFETLTREEGGAQIIPWLASEFHAEEGGRRFRFQLRDGLRFHDGRRLTARDVRYSFERLLHSRDTDNRFLLLPIKGARQLVDGEVGDLEGFRILSDTAFTIDLDRPLSFFPALIAFHPAAIVPEGSSEFAASWQERCVGTGPFRVQHFSAGKRLRLERNPYYWRSGYPRSEGLIFSFGVPPADILTGFRAGRYSLAWDLFPSDVEALRRNPRFAPRYYESPRLSTYYIGFNTHRDPLADIRVRRRFVSCVSSADLVRRNLGRLGIPAHGLIPPGLLGYEPPERAQSLATPVTISPAGIELSATVNEIYRGPYSAVAADLVASLARGGFRVKLSDAPMAQYYKALDDGSADVVLTRWIADYPDSDTFAHGLLHSKEGHLGRYIGSPELDQLIAKGRLEIDAAARHVIYRQIEELIEREALLLPLFHEQAYCFVGPAVEGFDPGLSPPLVRFFAYEKLSLPQ
ncbi:MAG: protein kinase [Acidobacteria bacterium]|nr:protein kinase [Acidobacteriota bacterium]